MAEHRSERTGSIASSSTDAATLHELTKLDPMEDSPQNLESRVDEEVGVEEDEKLLPTTNHTSETEDPQKASLTSAVVWMTVNTLATIGIVFTNKAIFSDPQWKLCQLTFASFHFLVTFLTLHILSRPTFAYFTPRRAAIKELLPLSVAMCLNVILPNLSLAFSSVTFYQIARILLTPTVALMNFVLYKATLPRNAVLALIPACFGVGMVSYYDTLPVKDGNVKTTSTLGVFFAFTGIFASSLYTVWIASYHRKLQMSSMQLLYNQAPIASFMLLYIIPFVDTFPDWVHVPGNRWIMIGMSGVFASLINISQFFIVAQTGPVSSTVVGHLKTCTIVALGWMVSGRVIGDKSILGVFIAIGGIVGYSVVMLQHQKGRRK
ncbi:putative triose-phosphate transporter [Colletotrichum sublineola]|uniref:GDP-mannose transporter n=1 Tax=Colletotrichum sublineola TaxID=1173701 RepID=A0A066XNK8_COLSU|nr:putative triose-phosphate transporter [Colletotrichum sublineola]